MWKLVEEQDFYLFFKLGLNFRRNPIFVAPPVLSIFPRNCLVLIGKDRPDRSGSWQTQLSETQLKLND